MDLIQKAAGHLQRLEARVQSLEAELREKDELIRRLSREVPATALKQLRLGIDAEELLKEPTPAQAASSSVEYWDAKRTRDTFIKFFEEKCSHVHWKSSPCVPVNDPTLLFANAGMNQFKPIFLGQVDPANPMAKLKRACNTQKCIRAGGKHNDLEDVGRDSYHHTFFEMLGNWSFGDYFKEEAISWAWELLTEVYKLPKDRLYATYFGGNESVPVDSEARSMWLKFLPESHVLPFDAKDNFWEMGDTGPCGPCTEIHFDRIGGRDASGLVNMDDPDVLEIWNLVFIQYNRKPNKELEQLPAKHVDTGMGFERLVSVLQNRRSNYDTDVFEPIFRAIEGMADAPPYAGRFGDDDTGNVDTAYRVLADHVRTLTFAITDGCVPSNDGRGYVLRRVLRRAVRYATDILNMKAGSFANLVPVLVQQLKGTFPDLERKQTFVMEVLNDEETTFLRTIRKGREYFEKVVTKLVTEGRDTIPGPEVFFLYATMGFPADLTEIMARERKLKVDMPGFEAAMEEARVISQRGGKGAEDEAGAQLLRKLDAKETDALEKLGVAPTEEAMKYVWHSKVIATVRAVLDADMNFVQSASASDAVLGVVLDRSNFYYESGGQQFDTGALVVLSADSKLADHVDEGAADDDDLVARHGTGAVFEVVNCQSSKGFVVHAGSVKEGTLKVGDRVLCDVNFERRKLLANNHTCTHLLNFGLRRVLGTEVDQKGSLVTPEKLRFDFNASALTPEAISEVETVVRKQIEDAHRVYTKVVPLADAKRINSLRAVFGETYPDPVRVVIVGADVDQVVQDPTNPKWNGISVELCGGTHLRNSADARGFAIVEEAAIAKGVRRITAITGEEALRAESLGEALAKEVEDAGYIKDVLGELSEACKRLQETVETTAVPATRKVELRAELSKLKMRVVQAEKERDALEMEKLEAELKEVLDKAGGAFVVHLYSGSCQSGTGPKLLRKLSKAKGDVVGSGVLLLVRDEDKGDLQYTSVVSKGGEKQGYDAGALVRAINDACDGKGGGGKASATGNVTLDKCDEALRVAQEAAGGMGGGAA